MSILNTFIALSLIVLMSFSLFKTIELSSCRHEMVSKGFWIATKMLTSSTEEMLSTSCHSPLYVEKGEEGIIASQVGGDYNFKLSTDINSRELK